MPLFGNGLKGHVTRDGRLISVQGSPVPNPGTLSATPRVSAAGARATAIRNVDGGSPAAAPSRSSGTTRGTVFADGDRASLVAFRTAGRHPARLADAHHTRGRADVQPRRGRDHRPGPLPAQPRAERQRRRLALLARLPEGRHPAERRLHQARLAAVRLAPAGRATTPTSGRTSTTTTGPRTAEEVAPGARSFTFPFTNFNSVDGPPCSAIATSAAGPRGSMNSWRTNRKQNAVQVFYFVNKFHDHLRDAPDRLHPRRGQLRGDRRRRRPGPAGRRRRPPPAATRTRTTWTTRTWARRPTASRRSCRCTCSTTRTDPTRTRSCSPTAATRRTSSTTSTPTACPTGSWSTPRQLDARQRPGRRDGRGLERLVRHGLPVKRGSPAQHRCARRGPDRRLRRPRPRPDPHPAAGLPGRVDRRAGAPARPGAGPGGYTYGDFGRIRGFPEVHADGEIWGETLWQLRGALGSK